MLFKTDFKINYERCIPSKAFARSKDSPFVSTVISMSDKKRKRTFYDDLMDEDNFMDIEDIIERMMEKYAEGLSDVSKRPFIYGFSISKQPGEEPEIKEFGHMSLFDERSAGSKPMEERELLVDTYELDDTIYVTADLSDYKKEEIEILVAELDIELKLGSGEHVISEYIEIDGVDPDRVKATFKNGVLELAMKKKEFGKYRTIKIED